MNLDLKTLLDQQMMPINASVDAKGNLKTNDVVLTGYVPMIKLAEKTGLDKWKQPIHIKDVNVNFTIQQGIIKVQPFTVKVDDIPVKMEGQATLDQKIDYTLETDVPFDKFPQGIVNQANSFIGQINQKLGTQLKPGNKINLIARITGDVTNPDVKVTSKALGEAAVQDLKEQAVQLVKEEAVKQVTELKNDALEKAKAEKEKLVQEAAKQAEKLKSEARTAAEKAKAQAYAEADKLASKGGNFVEKAANKKLAEEMRKSADKAYTKSIAEADKKADQLVKDANAKGDQLIQKANSSGDQQINKIK
jgi:vacuolar-type H+-ATPase subunit H